MKKKVLFNFVKIIYLSIIQEVQNNFNELILYNILNAVHYYNNREHNKRCSAQNIVIDSNLNSLRFCCVKNINN